MGDNVKEYKGFMYNEENAYNCDNCPENIGDKDETVFPCGQYHCWVVRHCSRCEESETE